MPRSIPTARSVGNQHKLLSERCTDKHRTHSNGKIDGRDRISRQQPIKHPLHRSERVDVV
jgi:hypothetical protein